MVDLGGPKEPCIRWYPNPQRGGAIFGVVRRIEKHCKAGDFAGLDKPAVATDCALTTSGPIGRH